MSHLFSLTRNYTGIRITITYSPIFGFVLHAPIKVTPLNSTLKAFSLALNNSTAKKEFPN
ncbi:MAG: hypothetical protein RSA44_04170 [Bacteroides sp.]